MVNITTTNITGDIGAQFPDGLTLTNVILETALSNGSTIKTGTTAADAFKVQAYDVNGSAYLDFITVTANNVPTLVIEEPAGGILNIDDDGLGDIDIALAASTATDGMDITITVQDSEGNTRAGTYSFDVWISEDENGAGLTGDTYSGDVTVVTGAELVEHTSKKYFSIATATTGIAVMRAVASANPTDQYVCVRNPFNGQVAISAASGTNWQGA